eukprot:scpid73179/ scgid25436/ RAD50-interacting protein 1; RAD50 interactor 1
MEEQRQYLDEQLRIVCIDDIPRARKVLQELLAERAEISQQISSASSSGSSTALDAAVNSADNYINEVDRTVKECSQVSTEVERCQESAGAMCSKLSSLLDRAQPLLRCQHYLQWVKVLDGICVEISTHHGQGNTASAVDVFHDLLKLQDAARESWLSDAGHLHSCIDSQAQHWRRILEALLTKDFEETLKALHWPFVSGTAQKIEVPTELLSTFRQQLHLMFKLKPFCIDTVQHDDPSYPLELMLQPLRKRFRYHFHSKRQTNDIKKPEWYLTQIRSWITAHASFLKGTIQPLFSECCGNPVPVERLFVRAMISLVTTKLAKDSEQLLAEPSLLSHTIDELLSFISDLGTISPTTATEKQALLVMLEQKDLLTAWLSIEEMLIMEHVEKSLSSPTAWQAHYREVEDIDDTRAPECAEVVMTYAHAVTDRYKLLPSLEPRLLFCRLQVQSVEVFSQSIVKRMEAELGDCTGMMFASLLCAVQYVADVLSEWSEQPFFLSLEERLQEESVADTELSSSKSSPLHTSALPAAMFFASRFASLSLSGSSSKDQQEQQQQQQSRSVFSHLIIKLNSIKQKMMENMVEAILSEFRLTSKPFVQQKWVAFPPPQDVVVPEVSDAACDLLVSLRHHLRLAEKRLPLALFTPVWINLAKQLDVFVFDKVIQCVTLTEGGASQLHFDLMRNLVTLFSICTARPERYFPLVREACYLLTLRPGSAALLRDELLAANKENSSMARLEGSATQSAEKELSKMDVKNLNCRQVADVLARRVDWPQT